MILESLITTVDPGGTMHVAPMGPRVDAEMQTFLLRPYPTSRTYQNLCRHPEGVLHVSDDVLLFAKAAIGQVQEPPLHRPAEKVRGFILNNACRAYEFRVKSVDEFEPRVKVECQVVRVERMRDFFGFNRAKHAIVEAAILASRVDFLDIAEIEAEFAKLTVIVVKTGGPQEHDAMALLQRYVADCRGRRRREP
jgi:uncharacterized protein